MFHLKLFTNCNLYINMFAPYMVKSTCEGDNIRGNCQFVLLVPRTARQLIWSDDHKHPQIE